MELNVKIKCKKKKKIEALRVLVGTCRICALKAKHIDQVRNQKLALENGRTSLPVYVEGDS